MGLIFLPMIVAVWASFMLASAAADGTSAKHAENPNPGRTFRDCPHCEWMKVLPASYVSASRQALAIAVYDTTRADYARFVAATGYSPPAGTRCDWRNPQSRGRPLSQTPNDPVVCVSWSDAMAYVHWLSTVTGKQYRLPTEAEWEYAAGPSSGADGNFALANTGADLCCGPGTGGKDRWIYTSPVGSFPANRFGLYDMVGNVWQWVADCEALDGDSAGLPIAHPKPCERHVVKGGGWFHPPDMARSSSRVADETELRVADIGFRIARSLSPAAPNPKR